MSPLVAAMAVGPFLQWKRADLMGVIDRLKVVAIATLLLALAVAYVTDGGPVLAVLAMGLAAWLFVGALVEWAGRRSAERRVGKECVRTGISRWSRDK